MQQVDHPVGSARPNRPPPPSSAGATARRSIRLPDLSTTATATVAPTSSTKPSPATKAAPWSKRVAEPEESNTSPTTNEPARPLQSVGETAEPVVARNQRMTVNRLQQLRELAVQPKVWLALATAIIVQLVLSWAFSPKSSEAEPADHPALQNRRIAADAPAAEPAARIVAPPAAAPTPSTGVPDAGEAVPLGSVGEGAERWPGDSATASAEPAHGASPAPIRIAENVRPGKQTSQFDGQGGGTAGATLDALVPLDTESEAPGGNP